MKREIRIPVRELVGYTLRSGDLAQEFSFSTSTRALDGIRAHQRIQAARPKQYQPEVTVSHQLETGDSIITISGRIDGVYRYTGPDRVIIDEIKSTTQDPDIFEKEENPIHWGQARVYAYIYALQQELSEIDVQLTYFQLANDADGEGKAGKTREYVHSFTFPELEDFFNQLLNKYLEWLATLEEWFRLRDQSIEALAFPYEAYRPGQRRMALDIYRTIEAHGQLMIEAPTGIGKTMAAVFPAVKAVGAGLTDKFFYLTAKTTGRTVARKALEDLKKHGLRFKSLTLTAKEKTCFNPGSACNGEECEFARGFFDRINEAVATLFKRDDDLFTRDVVEAGAREFTVCPFELSLELSLWSDCIICDYNYAFDPRVYLRRFFGEEGMGKDYVFLVDEANNLVDRSREMFSAELYKKTFLDLRRVIKKKSLADVSRNLTAINNRMASFRQECEEAEQPLAQHTYPTDFSPHLRRFTRAAERWLAKNIDAPYRKDLITLYFDVNWFLKVAENYYEAYSTCLEEIGKDFRIKLFCMDPSQQLTEAFERCSAVVFFSATLSPMDYFRRVLGCAPDIKEIALPSPFPREHLCLPVADRVSTLYKYRQRSGAAVAHLIDALVRSQPGNYLVFFPSYLYMKMIHDLFAAVNTDAERIVQPSGMTETQREEFLENFDKDNRSRGKTLVGFAVMGGIFGEGIDLKGDRLTGAVIVGVGLPAICLERNLIKDYFDQLQDAGFEYAYLYPGMNRVFQAAGRVIRSDHDRGVVLLIGHRFSAPQYKALLPGHWNPVSVRDEQQLGRLLDQFWENV